MSEDKAVPKFGGALRTPDFYAKTNSIISLFRPIATLRTIANHLNEHGFETASGLLWTKGRLTNYLQSAAAATI